MKAKRKTKKNDKKVINCEKKKHKTNKKNCINFINYIMHLISNYQYIKSKTEKKTFKIDLFVYFIYVFFFFDCRESGKLLEDK